MLRISSDDLFVKGDELKPQGKQLLKEFANIANEPEAKKYNFLIVTHSPPGAGVPRDLVTTHPTPWHLTAHQAIAVEQSLEENGLSPTRVGIISYAGQQPLVEEKDPASQKKNARVEIYLTPPDPPAKRK